MYDWKSTQNVLASTASGLPALSSELSNRGSLVNSMNKDQNDWSTATREQLELKVCIACVAYVLSLCVLDRSDLPRKPFTSLLQLAARAMPAFLHGYELFPTSHVDDNYLHGYRLYCTELAIAVRYLALASSTETSSYGA